MSASWDAVSRTLTIKHDKAVHTANQIISAIGSATGGSPWVATLYGDPNDGTGLLNYDLTIDTRIEFQIQKVEERSNANVKGK